MMSADSLFTMVSSFEVPQHGHGAPPGEVIVRRGVHVMHVTGAQDGFWLVAEGPALAARGGPGERQADVILEALQRAIQQGAISPRASRVDEEMIAA